MYVPTGDCIGQHSMVPPCPTPRAAVPPLRCSWWVGVVPFIPFMELVSHRVIGIVIAIVAVVVVVLAAAAAAAAVVVLQYHL